MKTDDYLTLCLEQAAKSPLRCRHGSIIVRGGKVIGQGYNDHRAGFDGGALKTGRLPLRSVNVSVTGSNTKRKRTQKQLKIEDTNNTLISWKESRVGGKFADTALSMHSEMMAIHSALSASSLSASKAVAFEKPYLKLSSGSKPRSRSGRQAIQSHDGAAYGSASGPSNAASHCTESNVQEWLFEPTAPQ